MPRKGDKRDGDAEFQQCMGCKTATDAVRRTRAGHVGGPAVTWIRNKKWPAMCMSIPRIPSCIKSRDANRGARAGPGVQGQRYRGISWTGPRGTLHCTGGTLSTINSDPLNNPGLRLTDLILYEYRAKQV
ncbi:hypothetical protein FKM82_025122 [Ascaphus truei]